MSPPARHLLRSPSFAGTSALGLSTRVVAVQPPLPLPARRSPRAAAPQTPRTATPRLLLVQGCPWLLGDAEAASAQREPRSRPGSALGASSRGNSGPCLRGHVRAQFPESLVWGPDGPWNPPLRSCGVPVRVKTERRTRCSRKCCLEDSLWVRRARMLPRTGLSQNPCGHPAHRHVLPGLRWAADARCQLPVHRAPSLSPQNLPVPWKPSFLSSFCFPPKGLETRAPLILFCCQLPLAAESRSHLYSGPCSAPSLHTLTPIHGLLTDACGFSFRPVLSTYRRQINFQESLLPCSKLTGFPK